MTYATTKARYRAKSAKALTSSFDVGRFVAIDGEGFNEPDTISITIQGGKGVERTYTGRQHCYSLLMASDGSEIYNPTAGLITSDCLDFLIAAAKNTPNAILVCFGASYDVTHMLRSSLTRDEIIELLRGGTGFTRRIITVRLGAHDYRLEYTPRKTLTIWRWPAGADKYERKRLKDGSARWQLTPHDRAQLWDVWGFFQASFVKALQEWLPNHPATAAIAAMKALRSVFARSDLDAIRAYTKSELETLVLLMDAVRDSLRAQDVKIARYDGAGAIAGALMKKHDMKAHMQPSPDHIFQAARIAYSGGHIEACRLGYHNKPVYHYDINSAYPDQIRRLPSLAGKSWVSGTGTPPAGFTLVHAVYSFRRGLPFYPLFHRSERGSILYPREGEGWYWYDEFCAGVTFASKMGGTIDAIEWHHLETSSNESPFQWVEDAYLLRQAIVAETRRTGVPNGAEKTIKLGLNSVAGKTAQQVGARMVDGEIVPSAYFQLEWAGAITAGCRAKLMLAALKNPDAVISFATDAVFSTEPLDVYCPPEKILGAWERVEHEGITLVMPGVYWLHDKTTAKNPTGLTHYSRGIGKGIMSDVALIHEGWRTRQTEIGFENESMVTLGAASMSENFWPLRGLFVTAKRNLKMNGHNSKRYPVALSQCAPHRELVRTWPQEVFDCDDGGPVMSAPFEIAWIADTDGDDAAEAELLNSSDAIEAAFFL